MLGTQLKCQLTVGPTGFVTKELLKKEAAPASLGDKVMVFVCGTYYLTYEGRIIFYKYMQGLLHKLLPSQVRRSSCLKSLDSC